MKVEITDDAVLVFVRQSWLNDAMLCPERSRLAVTLPDWRSGSDATILGTAVHTGIEKVLNNETGVNGMKDYFMQHLDELYDAGGWKWTSMGTKQEMQNYGIAMCDAWVNDILPSVETGGQVEKNFTVHLGEYGTHEGKPVHIFLNGTIDYVSPSGVVWDWKTAARKYSQSEKQKQSIQASVYCKAVYELNLAPEYPVRFNYGVMTRSHNSIGQIVPVIRTEAHSRWLEAQVVNLTKYALAYGFESPWLANDQNNLCSQKWCSYWSVCKGAHLSDADNNNKEIIQ